MTSHVPAKTSPQVGATTLHLVQKIYVADMGISPEAARFRLLLEDQLSEKGFVVVPRPEDADAVLAGAVSLSRSGVFGGPADINVTARLTSAGGVRLWSVNSGGQIVILNPVSSLKFNEPLEYRAKELAKKLSHAREQSAKSAGVKLSK
jgi:hypothetical protein